jgi:hypothetical protein
MGLARSIINGVGELLKHGGRAIVVEDDLALAPGFLDFMNSALERYADDAAVFQISGHIVDVDEFADRRSALFLPFIGSWGWATWSRAWHHFDEDAAGWQQLVHDRDLRKKFNLGNVYDYSTMLQRQMRGRLDSWGVRWYWSVFRQGGMTLFPPRTLVANKGMDGSGTHGRGFFRHFRQQLTVGPEAHVVLPSPHVNSTDFETVRRAIWRQNGGVLGHCVDGLKKSATQLLGL